ncbi:hypothetical protein SDC9_90833 [bioreactor metagenome]|uniref:Uncharacterized protein n=1 Tax=bioreactor metagenome TaxID=1076179 RepID=A0A644ZTD6_9ZZZZ
MSFIAVLFKRIMELRHLLGCLDIDLNLIFISTRRFIAGYICKLLNVLAKILGLESNLVPGISVVQHNIFEIAYHQQGWHIFTR